MLPCLSLKLRAGQPAALCPSDPHSLVSKALRAQGTVLQAWDCDGTGTSWHHPGSVISPGNAQCACIGNVQKEPVCELLGANPSFGHPLPDELASRVLRTSLAAEAVSMKRLHCYSLGS